MSQYYQGISMFVNSVEHLNVRLYLPVRHDRSQKANSLLNQSIGACLSPWRDFHSRKVLLKCNSDSLSRCLVCMIQLISPFKNEALASRWPKCHPLQTPLSVPAQNLCSWWMEHELCRSQADSLVRVPHRGSLLKLFYLHNVSPSLWEQHCLGRLFCLTMYYLPPTRCSFHLWYTSPPPSPCSVIQPLLGLVFIAYSTDGSSEDLWDSEWVWFVLLMWLQVVIFKVVWSFGFWVDCRVNRRPLLDTLHSDCRGWFLFDAKIPVVHWYELQSVGILFRLADFCWLLLLWFFASW